VSEQEKMASLSTECVDHNVASYNNNNNNNKTKQKNNVVNYG